MKNRISQIRHFILLTSQYMIDYNSNIRLNDPHTNYQLYSTDFNFDLLWENLEPKINIKGGV